MRQIPEHKHEDKPIARIDARLYSSETAPVKIYGTTENLISLIALMCMGLFEEEAKDGGMEQVAAFREIIEDSIAVAYELIEEDLTSGLIKTAQKPATPYLQ